MSSEESVTDLLTQIQHWGIDEVREKIDEVLPVLVSSLECDEKTVTLQAAQVLLGTCLQCLAVNSVENAVLQPALSTVRQIFAEALEGIHLTLESSDSDDEQLVDTLVSLLQVCIEILKCLDSTLQYIVSQGNVDAIIVPTIPRTVVTVLQDSFKHCQMSESTYGNIFQLVSEVLMELFNKSHEVLLNFLMTLSENFQFNCLFEDELTLVTEVLESLGHLCEYMKGLGVKVLADSWKGYILLVEKYSKDLRPFLNVTAPIKFLVQDIVELSETLLNAQTEYDKPNIVRNLKVASFELKLILKLCECYVGYLNDCYTDLFHLQIMLQRLSPSLLSWKNVPTEIVEEIEKYLSIGADPLLTHLIGDRCFVQEYFSEVEKLVNADELSGFIGLSLGIMKKIVHCEQSVRKLWLPEDDTCNLLCILFKMLDSCHLLLCSDIRIPATIPNGDLPRQLDVYETVLIHTSAVIITTPSTAFGFVERLLLASILQHNLWRALLATDIWCIVSRYGSPDLCYHHLTLVADMLKLLEWNVYRPEVIFLTSVLKRLYPLLPPKHRMQVVDKYPLMENTILWLVLQPKAEEIDSAVSSNVIKQSTQLIDKFLQGSFPTAEYKTMLNFLAVLPNACDNNVELSSSASLTRKLTELWSCATHLEDTNEIITTTSFSLMRLLKSLVVVTSNSMASINNRQIIQVVAAMKEIAEKGSSAMKLQILPVLQAMASKTFEKDEVQSRICFDIGILFSTLMQDKNSIVRQESLNVFATFSYVTKHEEIVIHSVSQSSELQNHVALFLKKQYDKYNGKDKSDYLKFLQNVKFCHSCAQVEQTETVMEELDEHKAKKQKVDECPENVSIILDRILSDTALIIKICEKSKLPEAARTTIVSIMAQLEGAL